MHLPSSAVPTGKIAEMKYCWLIPAQRTGPVKSLLSTLSWTVSCSYESFTKHAASETFPTPPKKLGFSSCAGSMARE